MSLEINIQNPLSVKTPRDILTDEEKSSYYAFAHRVREMSNAELFKLNGNMADRLNSEMKDIVAFEIKTRELELLQSKNIDPAVDFAPEKIHVEPGIDHTTPNLTSMMMMEENFKSEMSDELLENSKKIIENQYIEIDTNDMNVVGRGVNIMFNKYLAVDNNGNSIRVDNRKVQERFRREYLNRLSDVTGLDYTKFGNFQDDIDYSNTNIQQKAQQLSPTQQINLDDYELD